MRFCVLTCAMALVGTCLGQEAGNGAREELEKALASTVAPVMAAINDGDQDRAREEMAKLFPKKEEMLTVFPKKGDEVWEKLKGAYALEDNYHVRMVKLWELTGKRTIHELQDIRSEKGKRWTYYDITKLVDAKYPLYKVLLRSGRSRRLDSFATFVHLDGRWIWFQNVERVALEVYKDEITAMKPPVVDDPSVPGLIEKLRNKETRAGAARALGALYNRAIGAAPGPGRGAPGRGPESASDGAGRAAG